MVAAGREGEKSCPGGDGDDRRRVKRWSRCAGMAMLAAGRNGEGYLA
jgi:hypothetical protein